MTLGLALLIVAWALCRAAVHGDGRMAAAGAAEETGDEAAVVADLAALRTRLRAAAVMLEAERLAVVHDGHELAATDDAAPAGAQDVTAPVARGIVLVASRSRAAAAFDDGDRRLLDAIAESLRQVLDVPDDEPPRRSGRFARPREVRTPWRPR